MQIRFSLSVEVLAATHRTAVTLNSESKRNASTPRRPSGLWQSLLWTKSQN
jgi:hypothetical protein